MTCYPNFINRPLQISYIDDNGGLLFDVYIAIDKGLRIAHHKFRTSSTLSKEEQIQKITNYFENKVKDKVT